MRHLIIQIESIMKYPPTLSLIKILREFGDEVFLCSSEIDADVKNVCDINGAELIDLGFAYCSKNPVLSKLGKILLINRSLRKILKNCYNSNSVIWIMTSISLKYIGNCLNNKKYIMYMYELSQELCYYQKIPFLKINIAKLLKGASAVIECEYNRAHIVQAWFGLKKTPYVIPNKPYIERIERKMPIEDEYARSVIEKIKDKKIILYQGIIDVERPLTSFIEAIDSMGDEYALVVMSSDVDKLKNVKSNNLYLVPFVKPPHHLEVTSWAYIGILTYYPVRNATTSPLNAIYCAPNKIYEYAMFGAPMIGNNIPGLKYSVEKEAAGCCFNNFNSKEIRETIIKIEENYMGFMKNSYRLFDKTNTKSIINGILRNINN